MNQRHSFFSMRNRMKASVKKGGLHRLAGGKGCLSPLFPQPVMRSRVKASVALLGMFFVINASRFGTARGAEQRSVSVGDCTFSARPDDFLARESRLRRDVSGTAVKLNNIMPRAVASPVPASSLPHRNFIDDLIFGALTAQKVPA